MTIFTDRSRGRGQVTHRSEQERVCVFGGLGSCDDLKTDYSLFRQIATDMRCFRRALIDRAYILTILMWQIMACGGATENRGPLPRSHPNLDVAREDRD